MINIDIDYCAPTFTPVKITFNLTTQESYDIFLRNMNIIGGGKCADTDELFDDCCEETYLTLTGKDN